MRIYIESIETELRQQGRETGYLIRFRSELTSGTALLAATHSVGPALRGQEIFAEVEAQSFEDVGILPAGRAYAYHLDALPEAGCYRAVGEIVYRSSEEDDDATLMGVRVADALFHWPPDDSDGKALMLGSWVRFTVVGLVLWDMNL